jgi:hypothetical protein
MKRLIPFFGAICLGMTGGLSMGTPVELSPYRMILDRKPFGSETPPTPAAGGAAASALVEPYVKFLKISAFVRDDFSPIIRVGLVETRTNQSYLLAEGESADGILLIRAEFDRERVLLSKENLVYWLAMDGTYILEAEEARQASPEPSEVAPVETEASPKGGATPVPKSSPPKTTRVRPSTAEPPVPVAASGAGASTGPTSPRRTLTERRRMIDEIRKRRAELAQNQSPLAEEKDGEAGSTGSAVPSAQSPTPAPGEIPPLLEGSEMERQLQEYQMQAIREGRAPLPIPLTPEIDAQLVNEGVLPPVE